MEILSTEFPLATVARALGVSRAVHDREPGEGPRAAEDAWLTREIQRIFKQHKKRYGSPRIHTQLRREGIPCGENRVARAQFPFAPRGGSTPHLAR